MAINCTTDSALTNSQNNVKAHLQLQLFLIRPNAGDRLSSLGGGVGLGGSDPGAQRRHVGVARRVVERLAEDRVVGGPGLVEQRAAGGGDVGVAPSTVLRAEGADQEHAVLQ